MKEGIEAAWRCCSLAALSCAAGWVAPLSASAELEPVGLEAQGVDPWAALRRDDLDVRDAFNRPVSRRLIERQLKAANSGARNSVSFLSHLPKARTVLALLERLLSAACGIAAPSPWSSLGISAQSWAGRPSPKISVFWIFLSLLPIAAALKADAALKPAQAASRLLVLRC